MDWSNPIGSAVSGLFGLAGSAMNYSFQNKLQDKQNQFNLDMWNLQNEYNSPQAQMKRFEEAGLNPALMYSQGNAGNAVNAPVQGVPDAPNISQDMRELAQAFNIEGLRTAIANRKKAQADARIAAAGADDAESDLAALNYLQWNYHFDPQSGKFVYDGGVSSDDGHGNITSKDVYHRTTALGLGKAMRILSDNFRTNALIIPRHNLIGSQQLLNQSRRAFLAPQIQYQTFQATPWRMKTRFWIGNVKDAAQTVGAFY